MRLLMGAVAVAGMTFVDAAASDWSGNLALRSDAVYRGLDQDNGAPSPAAGLDATLGPHGGVRPYLGAAVAGNRMAGGAELDFYGGASRSGLFRDLYPYTLDGGVIAYVFPQADDGLRHRSLDAAEIYGGLSVGPASLKLWLSPDYFGSGGAGGYLRGRLLWPLGAGFSVETAAGFAAGPGVRHYTAALTADRRGGRYADLEAGATYEGPAGWSLRATVSAITLDLGEQATGGRQPWRLGVELRRDFDLGRT